MSEQTRLNQSESGKAWEYGLARQFATQLGVPLDDNRAAQIARKAYDKLPLTSKGAVDRAAHEAVQCLRQHERRLDHSPKMIILQADHKGQQGDVRDILIRTAKAEIGISAKHRHADIKHPRLSENIDIAREWLHQSGSSMYANSMKFIFDYVRGADVDLWRDLPNKVEAVYVPAIEAVRLELQQLYDTHGEVVAQSLFRYLIGRNDFYKVMKENGTVRIQSFNLDNTLELGRRVSVPTEIQKIDRMPRRKATLRVTFGDGWQMSLRVHNAESRLTTSLKFAVQLNGLPPTLDSILVKL